MVRMWLLLWAHTVQLFYCRISTKILLQNGSCKKNKELNTFLLLTYGIFPEIILIRGNGELLLKFSSLLSIVH